MAVKFENEREWQKETSSKDENFPANRGIIPVSPQK
jgi:hypothetical protein